MTTSTKPMPYLISIETGMGAPERGNFHLGTIVRTARQIVEERFAARVRNGLPTVTIALTYSNGKITDVFMGDLWQSQVVAEQGGVKMQIYLSQSERHLIANAINIELQQMARDYAASCDRKAPNMVLLQAHGELMRLRDKVLTGKSYAEQDAADQRAAEFSERFAVTA